MIRAFAIAIAALALSASLPATAAAADLAKAEGGRFVLDKRHAKLIFAVDHLGFSTYYGFLTGLAGTLDFDPAAPAQSVLSVTIDLAQIVTTDRELDDKLRSETFFDVARFPKATFRSTSIKLTGEGTGRLTGDLTLHGVTKPVTLDVTFKGAGTPPLMQEYVIGFEAVGTLKRSEFGIKNFVPLVGDEVRLLISCEFDRAPKAQ